MRPNSALLTDASACSAAHVARRNANVRRHPMPVLAYWLLGSLAAGIALMYAWPYDHSTGSLAFYGVLVGGIVLGLIQQAAIRRRASAGKPQAGGGNDV